MPEPDFDQIARDYAGDVDHAGEPPDSFASRLAASLRQVWNARGAADCASIKPAVAEWREQIGVTVEQHVERAIVKLDR